MNSSLTLSQTEVETRSFITRVYTWMSIGLAITGWVAWMISRNESFLVYMMTHKILFYGLLFGTLGMVIWLTRGIQNMSAQTATLVFLSYAALNGVTFATLFMLYTAASIASTFFITAGMFGAMSFYGYVTKKDLTGLGGFLFMGVIGLILASVVNIFWNNSTLYWITSYAGVLIFVGLTAYDTQRIKNNNIIGNAGTEEDHKESIMGALTLYLDFINMFLYMLRILGNRK